MELLAVSQGIKWIGDYNNVAPDSGLGMKSPAEYRKLIDRVV